MLKNSLNCILSHVQMMKKNNSVTEELNLKNIPIKTKTFSRKEYTRAAKDTAWYQWYTLI